MKCKNILWKLGVLIPRIPLGAVEGGSVAEDYCCRHSAEVLVMLLVL